MGNDIQEPWGGHNEDVLFTAASRSFRSMLEIPEIKYILISIALVAGGILLGKFW